MEAPIQELEKEFDQINFDHIIASKQDENIQSESESDSMSVTVDSDAVDVKKNKKSFDIQLHDLDFDRNSPFNDDLQMDSNKKIESLEIQTQVEIHNENSKHEIDTNISQTLDLVSSKSHRNGEVATAADEDLTDKKPLNLQTNTSLNEQVLNVLV